jgi:hypothetical protein
MIKKLITITLFIMLIFTGCAKVSKEAENTIYKVSMIYGEQNPQIKEIKTGEDETKNPMYFVNLGGNFQKGVMKSRKLSFSMTTDGKMVWALTADTWQDEEVDIGN